MTFKEFVDLLNPYRKTAATKGEPVRNRGEFVLHLINNITVNDIPHINGLNPDTLARSKTIKANAPYILAVGLDKSKFETYIESIVDDGYETLCEQLKSFNINATYENYSEKLVDIWEGILKALAESNGNAAKVKPQIEPKDEMVEFLGVRMTKLQAQKIRNHEEIIKNVCNDITLKIDADINGSKFLNNFAYRSKMYHFFKENPDLLKICKQCHSVWILDYAQICSDKGEKWVEGTPDHDALFQ